jgi:hypothetical protein
MMRPIITLLFTTFLLGYVAFWNGYPLVTSDTGSYLNSAFTGWLMRDRPIMYSKWLYGTSIFQFSLWLPILAQCALLSVLLWRLFRIWLPISSSKTANQLPFLAILLLVVFTDVSWFASQLMPDIFTGMALLATLLFLYDDKKWRVVYAGVLLLSLMMHNSNLLTFLLFSLAFLAIHLRSEPFRKAAFQLLGVAALGFLGTMMMNWSGGKGMTLSEGTPVFLVGKFCENGILKKYLDESPNAASTNLFTYRDQLPNVAWDFIWNEDSPFHKTGGWEANQAEYRQISREILSSPRYYPQLVWKSMIHTVRQLTYTQVGDGLNAHGVGSNPYWKIQQYFPYELQEYVASRQNTNQLPFASANSRYLWFILGTSLLFFAVMGWDKNINPVWALLAKPYALCICFIVINAFVCANLANVLGRLNARLIWILPMMNIIFIFRAYLNRSTPSSHSTMNI